MGLDLERDNNDDEDVTHHTTRGIKIGAGKIIEIYAVNSRQREV